MNLMFLVLYLDVYNEIIKCSAVHDLACCTGVKVVAGSDSTEA
jgi:hypothetical protein